MPMPKQVRAEEIERFLGTVDGVASARLLTSASGEIDQIFVTADGGTEARAARRAVVAALVTRFAIPVEPWRVQVAALKQFAPAELPYLRALRIEETISATEGAARVQVAWERAGEQRTAFGQARGPLGMQHRLRTLAAATVDAARTVVEPSHGRIAIQHVSVTTCMDRPLVLVGISAGAPGGQDAFVGAAFPRDELSDAAVAAALDAVTKCLLRAAFEAPRTGQGDRRAHLEAMRRYARSERGVRPDAAGTTGQPTEPLEPGTLGSSGGPPAPEPAGGGSSIPAPERAPGEGLWTTPPRTAVESTGGLRAEPSARASSADEGLGRTPLSARTPDGERRAPGWHASAPSARPRAVSGGGGVGTVVHPDVLNDLREIRPEEKGGAVLAAHDNARVGVAPRTGRQAIEDEYFAPLIERRTPVHIRCRDGYELSHAVVRDVGTYTLVVETDGTTELLYKHAIISVRPAGARD
jgi:sRNA-binding regulator protein Hfq